MYSRKAASRKQAASPSGTTILLFLDFTGRHGHDDTSHESRFSQQHFSQRTRFDSVDFELYNSPPRQAQAGCARRACTITASHRTNGHATFASTYGSGGPGGASLAVDVSHWLWPAHAPSPTHELTLYYLRTTSTYAQP